MSGASYNQDMESTLFGRCLLLFCLLCLLSSESFLWARSGQKSRDHRSPNPAACYHYLHLLAFDSSAVCSHHVDFAFAVRFCYCQTQKSYCCPDLLMFSLVCHLHLSHFRSQISHSFPPHPLDSNPLPESLGCQMPPRCVAELLKCYQ